MPISNDAGKNWIGIVFKILEMQGQLKRILDIGPGHGTYSLLGRSPQHEWTAIEIWAPYIEQFNLHEKYDQIIISDVRYVDLSKIGTFDLVFLGDILEHMTKEEAQEVVMRLLETCRFMIISIPVINAPQEEESGNPFEKHIKEDWSMEEVLSSFPHISGCFKINDTGVFLLAKAPENAALATSIAKKADELTLAASKSHS